MKAVSNIILMAAAILFGCKKHSDYGRTLPNGYKLAQTNLQTTAIFAGPSEPAGSNSKDGIAVAAKIDRIAVIGTWVVGHVVSSPQSELVAYEHPGFFILDTKTGCVKDGLTESGWYTELVGGGLSVVDVALKDPEDIP